MESQYWSHRLTQVVSENDQVIFEQGLSLSNKVDLLPLQRFSYGWIATGITGNTEKPLIPSVPSVCSVASSLHTFENRYIYPFYLPQLGRKSTLLDKLRPCSKIT